MADFNHCLNFVLSNETYKNSKGDLVTIYENAKTGEISNYGISNKFLALINYTIQDPRHLSFVEITNLYKKYFWDPYNLGSITSDLVAQKIFDMMVNMGPYHAATLIQAALNSQNCPCVIDGKLGPHTLIEINNCIGLIGPGEMSFLEELRVKCISYYNKIAIGKNADNLKSWLVRANKIGIEYNPKPLNA